MAKAKLVALSPQLRRMIRAEKSDYFIVGARPSAGKSAFALQAALYWAVVCNKRVGFFSHETSREKLMDRLVACASGVPMDAIKERTLDDKHMICGRQLIHPSSQNWAVTEATSGYARLVLTIDVTRTSTKDTFDQVVDEIQYATDVNGFADLTTADINATGTRYQVAVCMVSLGPGGITGIASKLDMTEGGGAGGNLKVIALAGVAVTVTKGSKVKQKVADAAGVAMFTGLETGTWTVTLPADVSPPTRTVDIDVDYVVVIAYFSATINVTYPAGSTCTCTDGVTTLTAPDTSGTWACIVPNAGTWTATSTSGTETDSKAIAITTDGQNTSVELSYATYLYNLGDACDALTGGWQAIGKYNAP